MTLKFQIVSKGDIAIHLDLFRKLFPTRAGFSADYLDWLYFKNPDGDVCGFNAMDGHTLAATYVTIPTSLSVEGRAVRGLLSLNTATAPSYQGQGLFTKLATMTYEFGRERGFQAIYGVANQNSIGGFTRKLAFQDVAPLDVRLGVLGSNMVDVETAESSAEFRRSWTVQSLTWRLANPKAPLSVSRRSRALHVQGRTQQIGIGVHTQMLANALPEATLRTEPAYSPVELYIGKTPGNAIRRGLSLDVPERFKPSPLRLIYRSLDQPSHQIDPTRALIRFIDFDAY